MLVRLLLAKEGKDLHLGMSGLNGFRSPDVFSASLSPSFVSCPFGIVSGFLQYPAMVSVHCSPRSETQAQQKGLSPA